MSKDVPTVPQTMKVIELSDRIARPDPHLTKFQGVPIVDEKPARGKRMHNYRFVFRRKLNFISKFSAAIRSAKFFDKSDFCNLSDRNKILNVFSSKQTLRKNFDATAEELSELSGEDFDEECMDVQISDHDTVIGLFEIEAEESSGADVIAFGSKTLPKLRAHLEMAESASATICSRRTRDNEKYEKGNRKLWRTIFN